MFRQHQLENILFIDIETAGLVPDFHQLPERLQPLWVHKATKFQTGDNPMSAEALYPAKAAIHAEFGRVVCISCGYLQFDEAGKPALKLKSYTGPDEGVLLREFGQMLDRFMAAKAERILCAHNGKEFDFPFLGRRYLIQSVSLPVALRVQGKKPWEIPFLDTMELWKFGDYKAYTSLDLMSAVLGIPSPKDDLDGSQVHRVFWDEKDYERIKTYCEKDVYTTAQVLLRMSEMPLMG
ncbi:MAG: ribonuclease H-like domain-containing protein [Bacteroidia bacterium]|nr:ribonuclease H-like domain-containing protein [Bacteroidia bacterium]